MTEEIETQENKKLPVLRGELALLVVVLINSLGVVLMLYSGSGISAISSVPYAFSEVFNKISLGTWTYIFQGLLVLSLMIMRKKFVAPYLFSFVVGFAFSEMLDVHEMWIAFCRQPLDTGYFILSSATCSCASGLHFPTAAVFRSSRQTCFRENWQISRR